MTRRRYTQGQFRAAVADPEVRTMADLCRALGLVPRGGNYESLRDYAAQLEIDLPQQHEQRDRRHDAPRQRRSYTDQELLVALRHCRNYPELCRALGLRPSSGTYQRLRRHASQLGAPIPEAWSRPGRRGPDGDVRMRDPDRPSSGPPRPSIEYGEADLRSAVSDARCLAEAIRRLGDEPTPTTYRRIRRGLRRHGVDTSHFSAQARRGGRARRPLDQLLTRGSRTNGARLRHRLITEGRKAHVCEECGARRWFGQPIPLELEHVNGDRWDNRLENLRLLCPNCHALTPTYRGRNIGRSSLEDR
jgi:hypothetical protein